MLRNANIKREIFTVTEGTDLEQITNRSIYKNMQIGTIACKKNDESIEIRGNGFNRVLRPDEAIDEVDPDEIKRLMIHRTIKEHFDKELKFKIDKKPVKVLSLFFVDCVEHYRQYGETGNPVKGKYSVMFEEEFRKLTKFPDYHSLFGEGDLDFDVSEIHDGYFSIDKKGRSVDTDERNHVNRDNAERAYNLIMKEKEKLLSFGSKLRFIFSHSALKEGWDNPNFFQICTLRDMGSERERRQTLGRGLRLCVNQNGERLRGNDINTLTVIATENYEKFAENLQKEIERDTGIRFGIVEPHQFTTIHMVNEKGEVLLLGVEQSEKIWQFLKDHDFVDVKGKVQDSLRAVLKDGNFKLSDDLKQNLIEEHGEKQTEIIALNVRAMLCKLAGKLDIKNADQRIIIRTREAVLQSDEFIALWERIKYNTTYRIEFDNHKLIKDCTNAIIDCPKISKTCFQFRKAKIAIEKGGVTVDKTSASGLTEIHENDIELPDIITELQDKTQLTRKSIVQILRDSKRLQDFLKNPQQFIHYCSEAINRTKRQILVDGIRYTKIGANHFYAQELFQQEELKGYLKNTVEAQKSVYTYVVYDSAGVEKSFVENLVKNEKVKLYTKLPAWFKVPTPLGTYNPDWAVVIENGGEKKIYFVIETKSSRWWNDLRFQENAKIKFGKRHFEEVAKNTDNPARYIKAKDVDSLMRNMD